MLEGHSRPIVCLQTGVKGREQGPVPRNTPTATRAGFLGRRHEGSGRAPP